MPSRTDEPRPHTRCLYRSAALVIADHRCDGQDHGSGSEEASPAHVVAFVRRGAFARSVRGVETLADASQVLFFQRDEPYRVRHPARGGDACTTFSFRESRLLDMLEARDPSARDRKDSPFDATHALCPASIRLLHQRLFRTLVEGTRDDLLVEDLALRLCDASLRARAPLRRRRAPARPRTVRRQRELVEAARLVLQRRMRTRVLLEEVADEIGCSPFHLARIFREETGSPLHRHLDRLRLTEALARLVDGEQDLTELALSLGYGDHSHFTNAFRREFGMTPSHARRTATAAELARLSKNLQA